MLSEEEKEMSTKSKINSLINDIQNKLNKRVPNNYAPYKNIYNQGNSNYITNPSSLLQNNYISIYSQVNIGQIYIIIYIPKKINYISILFFLFRK